MTDEVKSYIVGDEDARMEISLYRDNVFVAIHDEYGFHSRTSFTTPQLEQIIDILTALKENAV